VKQYQDAGSRDSAFKVFVGSITLVMVILSREHRCKRLAGENSAVLVL
jgi:hypothetical protein